MVGERYYSQQYSLVEPNANGSHVALDQFDDHSYQAYRTQSQASQASQPARDPFNDGQSYQKPGPGPNRRRKFLIFGGVTALVLVIALAVGLGVGLTLGNKYDYTPSFAHVTNAAAFINGGATRKSPWDVNDGIGAGKNEYTYYSGNWTNFPNASDWVSFSDMWSNNLHTLQTSCEILGDGKNNSPQDIQDIYDAIQNRANASLVDHRFIFAVILQESHGCVRVKATKSSTGVNNPGLMQSHNGHAFSSSHANLSILAMVQDGTQGTAEGDGLVQNLNYYSNAYSAARGYNSGYIPKSGNLSEAAGATACYVSDIANRLTGWVNATSTCPGDS